MMRLACCLLIALMSGCASTMPVSTWTATDCHGATTPFATYALTLEDVPGFKAPIMDEALTAALARLGLEAASEAPADVDVRMRITRIQRGRPDGDAPRDAMDAPVPTFVVDRFTAHADIEITDRRDDRTIYRAALNRDHSLSGDVQLHDARAEALIAAALDRALAGLAVRCSD